MKTKWYYLYAGYYELWISDKKLKLPLTFISKHKTLENAEKAANKFDVHVIYDKDVVDDEEFYREIGDFTDYVAD